MALKMEFSELEIRVVAGMAKAADVFSPLSMFLFLKESGDFQQLHHRNSLQPGRSTSLTTTAGSLVVFRGLSPSRAAYSPFLRRVDFPEMPRRPRPLPAKEGQEVGLGLRLQRAEVANGCVSLHHAACRQL